MLAPITRSPRIMQFRTYDLEWYPHTYELRVAGTYDGDAYRHYKSVQDFLVEEALQAPKGTVYFAHAGGLADVQFILAELAGWHMPDLHIQAIFSGSSAIIVKVTRGKKTILFCDSYWLLRDKLASIAKGIGMQKGGGDYHCPGRCAHPADEPCILYAPQRILIEYNELDCVILWMAIDRLQSELLDLGGELRYTAASCAMTLFRRRYLKRPIPTHQKINEIARMAYTASRVEPFSKHCGPALYYDINSSFPSSMMRPQPGKLIDKRYGLPKDESALFLADCEVSVPDCYLPPLPYRKDGRVYFPTGKWRGWFCETDLQLLQETGGRIVKAYQSYVFEPFDDLGAFIETLWQMRATATDAYRKQVLKIVMNSTYGKFAENPEKERCLIHPKKTSCPHGGKHIVDGVSQCMSMVSPGIFLVQETLPVAHEHVPVAVRITALSRALLYRYAADALKQAPIHYCDTDSVVTAASLPVGPELGRLKLEHRVVQGTFLAPKFYSIECSSDCPCKQPGSVHVRSKGFARLSPAQFKKLERNPRAGVDIRRMARLRELWRDGQINPSDRTLHKALLLDETKPKRAPHGKGTRPWTVEEIDATV